MSRPRRILMTVDAVGGVWQYATELATALAGLGHETILRCSGRRHRTRSARRSWPRMADTRGYRAGTRLAGARCGGGAGAGLAVARLASEWRVDVVHLNQPALAADVAFAVPLVVVAHSCVATWWEAVQGAALPDEFGWRRELCRLGLARAMRSLPQPGLRLGARRALRICRAAGGAQRPHAAPVARPLQGISPSPPAGCGTKARTSRRWIARRHVRVPVPGRWADAWAKWRVHGLRPDCRAWRAE